MTKMIRIQFDLGVDKAKELEDLMKTSGVKTKKDLINNALTLLEWAIKERMAGRIVASVDEERNVYKEIVMPILYSVARA